MPKVRPLDPIVESENRIIDYIRGEMKRQNLNQEKMAEKMGIYQSGLSYKLSKRNLTMYDLIKIFNIFGTSLEKRGELMS